ncbi:MAG: AIR synthase-related protein [Elusimicrobiota bacterium]
MIKPLQGIRHDGPGDACVIWPHAATGDSANHAGFAVSHGLNPAYGKLDPYRMALACTDEALRNLLCVGADITRAALLDNFCWGDPDDPAQLGALVRAAEGCRDAALGFGAPFISGKDSLHNRAVDASGKSLSIPGTLLISALAPVPDVRKALTMDIKGPGNALYLVGWTTDDLGGSLFHEFCGRCGSCQAPAADPRAAAAAFKAVYGALSKGLVLSAHDLSEGGLGVCAAEMCFTGEFGATLDLDEMPRRSNIYADDVLLFSETPSRLLLEVDCDQELALAKALRGIPAKRVGTTVANPVLKVTGLDGRVALEASLCDLKTAWQDALPRRLG